MKLNQKVTFKTEGWKVGSVVWKVGWIQEIDEKTGMILIKSGLDYLLVSKENIIDVEEKKERDLG